MENIRIVNIENRFGETEEFVIIDKGNDEFASMPKAVWDEQQAQRELGGTL